MKQDKPSHRRVARAMAFEQPDIAPLWGWAFLGDFERNWAARYDTALSGITRHDIAILMGDESLCPSRAAELSSEGDKRRLRDGWGRTLERREGAYFEKVLSYPMEDLDPDAFEAEPPGAEIRWIGFDERVRAEREAGRFACCKIGGIYVRSHNLLDEGELLLQMAGDDEFTRALFGRMREHLTGMALETLRRADAWDEGLFVYDDMASVTAPMFSPKMFEKYLAPEYEQLIADCRRAGCKRFFFHSDGNILPVMDQLVGLGFQGFNPLEPRSTGELFELRKRYPQSVLLGGICNTRVLPRGDRREIEAHVRQVLELASHGGVVAGTHSIGDDVAPETFRFLMELIEKHGRYQPEATP